MEEAPKLHPFWLLSRKDRRLVEFVTIRTDGRIAVCRKNREPMNTTGVAVVLVADGTSLNDPHFVSTPWSDLVDLDVTVLAPDIINKVDTGIVFDALDLVTAMTCHGFDLNTSPSGGMFIDIGNIPVAAVTGIGTVDGLNEFHLINFLVTFKTRGIVDAFETELPVADLQPLLYGLELLFEAKGLAKAWRNQKRQKQRSK